MGQKTALNNPNSVIARSQILYSYKSLNDSHSSIKASAAGVNEASDHSVEDEGQDLTHQQEKRQGATQSWNLSLLKLDHLFFVYILCLTSCVSVCYL